MLSRLRSPLIGFLTLLVFSCASQAPPLPPRVQVPESVSDLRSQQVGRKVALQWTLPEFATDGEPLTRPLEIEIFRHLIPAGTEPPETLPFAAPWATVLSADVRSRVKDGVMRFEDTFAERPGAAALMERLTELLFLEIAQRHLASGESNGLIGGLSDPLVADALRLIHAEPSRHWTLDTLSEAVSASR